MQIKLNTGMLNGIFSGTYYSMWEVVECDDNGNECDSEYDFENFMQSILKAYQDKSTDILESLGVDWIKSINFTASHSPREYNFSTDELDFALEIDLINMTEYLAGLINDDAFSQWLKDNYTSRDGFWSFTPNNYAELADNIINQGKEYEQAVSALINYAREQSDIEVEVFEYWHEQGYCGLDYKIAIEQ